MNYYCYSHPQRIYIYTFIYVYFYLEKCIQGRVLFWTEKRRPPLRHFSSQGCFDGRDSETRSDFCRRCDSVSAFFLLSLFSGFLIVKSRLRVREALAQHVRATEIKVRSGPAAEASSRGAAGSRFWEANLDSEASFGFFQLFISLARSLSAATSR